MPVLEAPPRMTDKKTEERLYTETITRNPTWIPINPARLKSGALVSLAKVFGEDKAQPIPLDPSSPLNSFELMATDIDISLAAKLSLGPIFSGSINYGDRAFYLDATTFADMYEEKPGNTVVGTRWGVGLRVLLHVYDIKGDLSLNIGLVGAAVDVGYAKAVYEIDGFGFEGGLQEVLGQLSGFGSLTAETYFKITDMVVPKFGEFLKTAKLKPVPFQVQLIDPIAIDPISSARPIVFAMRRLRDGQSLNEALMHAAGKYDGGEIKTVYQKLAPDTKPNDEPPQEARNRASDWLKDN